MEAKRVPIPAHSPLEEALRAVMRLGPLLLRSGTTNFRLTEAMNVLAAKLGIEDARHETWAFDDTHRPG